MRTPQADARGFVAKVADFGLSRLLPYEPPCAAAVGAAAVHTSDAAGTVTHMAPELLQGGPGSCASDVYSFGMLGTALLRAGLSVVSCIISSLSHAHVCAREAGEQRHMHVLGELSAVLYSQPRSRRKSSPLEDIPRSAHIVCSKNKVACAAVAQRGSCGRRSTLTPASARCKSCSAWPCRTCGQSCRPACRLGSVA